MAREEGAKYRFLTQPVKFIAGADGKLAAVECVEMKLGEPDAQGTPKSLSLWKVPTSASPQIQQLSAPPHQTLKHTIGA